MGVPYIGTTDNGFQAAGGDVIGAASGGTLSGSQTCQIVYDDTVFTEKQQLVAAVEFILDRLRSAAVFPITSSS